MRLLTALLFITMLVSAAQIEKPQANTSDVRIVTVNPSPESDGVQIKIILPEMNEMKDGNPVTLQVKVNGFPLGVNTDMPRASEIFSDPDGQCLHVYVDNEPYFIINEALVDTLDDKDNYFVQVAQVNIPFKLKPGMHVIRVLPVRSFNECLKNDRAYSSSVFYLQNKANDLGINLNKPYLTYNEPQGDYDFGQPILLDFHISNCQLSRDGYKIRFSIDGKVERTLTQWSPYYIYGLKPGTHRIRLELLDPENKITSGKLNDVQREINIIK